MNGQSALDKGFRMNFMHKPTSKNFLKFFLAAFNGFYNLAKLLIENKADVNIEKLFDETPLFTGKLKFWFSEFVIKIFLISSLTELSS